MFKHAPTLLPHAFKSRFLSLFSFMIVQKETHCNLAKAAPNGGYQSIFPFYPHIYASNRPGNVPQPKWLRDVPRFPVFSGARF